MIVPAVTSIEGGARYDLFSPGSIFSPLIIARIDPSSRSMISSPGHDCGVAAYNCSLQGPRHRKMMASLFRCFFLSVQVGNAGVQAYIDDAPAKQFCYLLVTFGMAALADARALSVRKPLFFLHFNKPSR